MHNFPGISHALFVRYSTRVFIKDHDLVVSDTPIRVQDVQVAGLSPLMAVGIHNPLPFSPDAQKNPCHYFALVPGWSTNALINQLMAFWQKSPLLLGFPCQLALDTKIARHIPALTDFLKNNGVLPVIMDGCKTHRNNPYETIIPAMAKRHTDLDTFNQIGMLHGVDKTSDTNAPWRIFPQEEANKLVDFYTQFFNVVTPPPYTEDNGAPLDAKTLHAITTNVFIPAVARIDIKDHQAIPDIKHSLDDCPEQDEKRQLLSAITSSVPQTFSVIARQHNTNSTALRAYFSGNEPLPSECFKSLQDILTPGRNLVLRCRRPYAIRMAISHFIENSISYCFEAVLNNHNHQEWRFILAGTGGGPPIVILPTPVMSKKPLGEILGPFTCTAVPEKIRVNESVWNTLVSIESATQAGDTIGASNLVNGLYHEHKKMFDTISLAPLSGNQQRLFETVSDYQGTTGKELTAKDIASCTETPVDIIEEWLNPYRVIGRNKHEPTKAQIRLLRFALGLEQPLVSSSR